MSGTDLKGLFRDAGKKRSRKSDLHGKKKMERNDSSRVLLYLSLYIYIYVRQSSVTVQHSLKLGRKEI
jgi:hypothetical protein